MSKDEKPRSTSSGGVSLLRTRSFFPLVGSLGISVLGNEVQSIAFLWWTLTYTNSPAQTAGVAFFTAVPRLLFSPIAGTIADRYDRRKLLLFTEAASALIIAATALLLHYGLLSPYVLFLVNFMLGAVVVMAVPAQQALIPNLVGTSHITQANAQLQLVRSTAGVLGPATGGTLIALLGIEGVTWLNFGSFIVSFLLINLLPPIQNIAKKRESTIRDDLLEGITYLRQDRGLLRFFAVMLLANVLLTPYAAVLPVMARNVIGVDAQGFGWLSASFFAGVMIGNLILSKLGKLSLIKFLGSGLALVGLALFSFGLSNNLLQGTGSLLILGIFVTFIAVTTVTFLQSYVPNHLRGRIFSVRYMTSSGVQSLGIAASGILAEQVGARAIFMVSGVMMMILGVVANLAMQGIFTLFYESSGEKGLQEAQP